MRLGKVRKTRKRGTADLLNVAERAVKRWEELNTKARRVRSSWYGDYPDAAEALEFVEEMELEAVRAASDAKSCVKELGRTVGPFRFTQPLSHPSFNGSALLKALVKHPVEGARFELLCELVERGAVTGFLIDKKAIEVLAQTIEDKGLKSLLKEAYDPGGKPLTPTVRMPG